jgi:hypothetical protein
MLCKFDIGILKFEYEILYYFRYMPTEYCMFSDERRSLAYAL